MNTLVALVAVFGWFWLVLVVNEHLKGHGATRPPLGRHWHVHTKSRGETLNG